MRRVLWTVLALSVAVAGSSVLRATADGTDAAKASCDGQAQCPAAEADCAKKACCDPSGKCCKSGQGCCGSCQTGSCQTGSCKTETAEAAGCPVAAKAAKLTEGWKSALAAVETGCPNERARVAAKIAALEADCPMGSRMESTLTTAKSVLAALERNAETCPQTSAAPAALKTDSSCCPGGVARQTAGAPKTAASPTTYVSMARGLQELTDLALRGMRTYESKASCGTAETGACASAASDPSAVAAGGCCGQKSESTVALGSSGCCGAEASSGCGSSMAPGVAESSCPQSLLVQVKALRESWKKVPAEFESMCPQKREELARAGKALMQESPIFALMPETVAFLADGVQRLATLHRRVASAHGEELTAAFQSETSLLEESAQLLAEVRTSMSPPGEATPPAPEVVIHER